MPHSIYGAFVAQKINKIRWLPDELSNNFITGSWDEQFNQIVVWTFFETEHRKFFPESLYAIKADADITELQFLNENSFVTSFSDGAVHLYRITDEGIEKVHAWPNLHRKIFEKSCTDIAVHGNNIATVGESGRLILLDAKSNAQTRINEADSSALTCVSFYKSDQVVTGDDHGLMKLWDLRTDSQSAASAFVLSDDYIGCTESCHHPNQKHVFLTGGEDGSIAIWDLRNLTSAVTVFDGHKQAINELMIHPNKPDIMFSCCNDGQLWQWDTSSSKRDIEGNTISQWTNPALRNSISVSSMFEKIHLPVNSLDVSERRLLCSCDNEAIYLISDIDL